MKKTNGEHFASAVAHNYKQHRSLKLGYIQCALISSRQVIELKNIYF